MSHDIHRLIPLERFRDILGELDLDHQSFTDAFWMRFAAQAAVFQSEAPGVLAKRIQLIADHLLNHAAWYKPLASPLRFVVAALLLKQHARLNDFLGEYHRVGEMLDKVALRHGGRYEPLTVLILMSAQGHDAFSLVEADRLKVLHGRLKKFHWWLTGKDDLPAIAALAQIPGSVDVIAASTETIYQRLTAAGCMKGDHLQTAAHLLPLTGLRPDDAANRWLALMRAMEAEHATLLPAHYDALSILSQLEQPATAVVARLLAVRRELDLATPDLAGTSSLSLAADLTALDLIRYHADGVSPVALEQLPQRLHALSLATMVQISQVEIDFGGGVEALPPMAWPM
jgi:Protein of unknown function (DUF4003)